MSRAARGGLADENELPDVADVPLPGWRVLAAGLAVAAAVMLVAEMFMALILRTPGLLLVAAPVTVAFLLTAGVVVGVAASKVTRGMDQRKATLVFFVAGFAAGALWGYPVFSLLIQASASAGGPEPAPAAAIAGTLYMASTTGLGALAGRYFGPWAATRPSLVWSCTGAVAIVTLIGVYILSGVDLT
ncbi:hypothetical protein ICW40_09375 [Actinotalea ferrariae]|uniref:hypothetical protein n=1 Tax=Actinotalea ferrariae TaxID=1386098 RepID=UPI001C8CC4D5|nr:hypothetical protein [Actinotalea ferrariae]MBX9245019.1 hypothetical protein [Actinotalea ferrariae]